MSLLFPHYILFPYSDVCFVFDFNYYSFDQHYVTTPPHKLV